MTNALELKTQIIETRRGEKIIIPLTDSKFEGDFMMAAFGNKLFGEATAYQDDRVWGEKVWVQIKAGLGYTFKTSYRTGKVESGTKDGVELGFKTARIFNTLDAFSSWIQVGKEGMELVITFSATQVAEEVVEEVAAWLSEGIDKA